VPDRLLLLLLLLLLLGALCVLSVQSPACFLWLMLARGCGGVARHRAGLVMDPIPLQHPGLFLLAAVMGFAVNVLAYATIKLASSLTLKVLGCVKDALLIVVAMILFSEKVTLVQGLGYSISTVAFMIYTHIKMHQDCS